MATKRARPGGRWEFIVKRKGVLPKPVYLTFDTEAEGDKYCARLEALLDRGIVPDELRASEPRVETLERAIASYREHVAVADSDQQLLDALAVRVGTRKLGELTYGWAEKWVQEMKRVDNLAPSTIRHYVGALSRCLDWMARRETPGLVSGNPLQLLPQRYATYTDEDARHVKVRKSDTERERRLNADEEAKLTALLQDDPALLFLMQLALESAMRLREMYTLTHAQLVVAQATVFLDKTKNGSKRQVPLSRAAIAAYRWYVRRLQRLGVEIPGDRIFPWWSGALTTRELKRCTTYVSNLWADVADDAGCADLRFHDLRHEATSRLYETTDLSDLEIAKITGHKDLRQLARYANLRASNLAQRLKGAKRPARARDATGSKGRTPPRARRSPSLPSPD